MQPVSSSIIALKEVQKNWNLHEGKIKHMKPMIRIQEGPKTSRSTPRLRNNPFRELQIEFENKSLLNRLTNRTNRHYNSKTALQLAKSNRKNYYESYKITKENEGLLRRLGKIKPVYDMKKIESSRDKEEEYIKSMTRFGFKGTKPVRKHIDFSMENDNTKYSSNDHSKYSGNEHTSYSGKGFLVSDRTGEKELRMTNNATLLREKSERLPIQTDDGVQKVTQKTRRINGRMLMITTTHKDAHLYVRLEELEASRLQMSHQELTIAHEYFELKYRNNVNRLLQSIRYDEFAGRYYLP